MNDRAFPHNEKNDDGSHYYPHGGMDLRDYFAGQALMGLLATGRIWPDATASAAYAHADAMLKIRNNGLAPSGDTGA